MIEGCVGKADHPPAVDIFKNEGKYNAKKKKKNTLAVSLATVGGVVS